MWLMYKKKVALCRKCKLSALCVVRGQEQLLNCLGMCRQCGSILLGGRITVETNIRSTGQTKRDSFFNRSQSLSVASLPDCVKRDGITDWPQDAFVDARDCPKCIATALNEALHELKGSKTWREWKEAMEKSRLAVGAKFTA